MSYATEESLPSGPYWIINRENNLNHAVKFADDKHKTYVVPSVLAKGVEWQITRKEGSKVEWTIGQRSKDTFQYIGVQKSFFPRSRCLIGQSNEDAAHWIISQSPTDKTTYEIHDPKNKKNQWHFVPNLRAMIGKSEGFHWSFQRDTPSGPTDPTAGPTGHPPGPTRPTDPTGTTGGPPPTGHPPGPTRPTDPTGHPPGPTGSTHQPGPTHPTHPTGPPPGPTPGPTYTARPTSSPYIPPYIPPTSSPYTPSPYIPPTSSPYTPSPYAPSSYAPSPTVKPSGTGRTGTTIIGDDSDNESDTPSKEIRMLGGDGIMRVIWQAKNGSIWLRREGLRPVRKVLVPGTKVRKRTWMYALWWGWNRRVGFKQIRLYYVDKQNFLQEHLRLDGSKQWRAGRLGSHKQRVSRQSKFVAVRIGGGGRVKVNFTSMRGVRKSAIEIRDWRVVSR